MENRLKKFLHLYDLPGKGMEMDDPIVGSRASGKDESSPLMAIAF